MQAHQLSRIAPALDAIRDANPGSTPWYDMLSDALVWSDEFPRDECPDFHLLRPVLRHRTCLIIGESSPFEDWWATALRLFPNWVGFRPERRSASPSLQQSYADGIRAATESIKRHLT